MKTYLSLFALLLAIHSNAQKEWVEEITNTYSLKHPSTWTIRTSETLGELNIAGPTPDFAGSSEHIGTTLFISSEDSEYSTIDSAAIIYKEELLATPFLKNIVIQEEEKIKFNGVDAMEITFTADIQHFSTACRIIIFQRNNIYYELSVSYDQGLSEKLLKEAHNVMGTFGFIE
ncbi:MAG: hypothetical protein HRT58_10640 [Crocinitomicaceae bacterium]|nr:hypothetical protein [Flavobacteriales bacterium]NQZ36111.1 hypothetical protein [Crocinitomicaceae bacterium]